MLFYNRQLIFQLFIYQKAGCSVLMIQKQTTLTPADAGIVSTQAITIRKAIFHLMPDKLVTEPTPMIEPAIVCVVEMGMPS